MLKFPHSNKRSAISKGDGFLRYVCSGEKPAPCHYTGSQRDFLTGGFGGLAGLGLSGGLAVL